MKYSNQDIKEGLEFICTSTGIEGTIGKVSGNEVNVRFPSGAAITTIKTAIEYLNRGSWVFKNSKTNNYDIF